MYTEEEEEAVSDGLSAVFQDQDFFFPRGVLATDSSSRLPFCDFLTGGLTFPLKVQSACGWDVGKMGPRKEIGIPVISETLLLVCRVFTNK